MTRDEAAQLEETIARVIASERKRTRFEFDREHAVLREQIAAAGRQIAALERDLATERRLNLLESRVGHDDVPKLRAGPVDLGAFDPDRHRSWRRNGGDH